MLLDMTLILNLPVTIEQHKEVFIQSLWCAGTGILECASEPGHFIIIHENCIYVMLVYAYFLHDW